MNPSQGERQRGAILPLVAIAMVVLFGFMALALDVGLMMWRKSQLHTAVDAAALSAAKCRFLDGEKKSISEACGNKTYRYNLEANDLQIADMPAFQWNDDQRHVDADVTSAAIDTLFAGGFFKMLSGNTAADDFSIRVKARAGLMGRDVSKALPIVVDIDDLCEKHSCDPADPAKWNLKPVQGFALLGLKNESNWPIQTLFDWLAGDNEVSEHILPGREYTLCTDDTCDDDDYKDDDFEDAIEDGLNTRFRCEIEDHSFYSGLCDDDDDNDDFPYSPEKYQPDVYVGKLNQGNEYKQYQNGVATCANPANGGNKKQCWEPESEDPENQLKVEPRNYRRVLMAGIGDVQYYNDTASITSTGCFVLAARVDDPEDKEDGYDKQTKDEDVDGIWLKYIPPVTKNGDPNPDADAMGCNYGQLSNPSRLVLLRGTTP